MMRFGCVGKKGETEIKFWHEKDIGFSGRKPISVDDESLV